MQVRTRFAPSPTGYLHIGGLRTALYAWLFARKHGGRFILRIEDTDQERLVEGAEQVIYDTLRQTGLFYDEGPDVGGEHGPYIQSERKGMGWYKQYAEQLVENGGAYYCFCDKQRLDDLRAEYDSRGETFKYDKRCKHLPPEEIAENLKTKPYVIRQDIPENADIYFDDMVYGRITVNTSELDDNVLLKADGMPTYNFANVVDDHMMNITHVLRGSEYLSSTPKYDLLYDGLGWDRPAYIHLPPVMKDKSQKLSKRHGDASFDNFIQSGYLKEAIINYIALLGWNPGSTREIFTLEELIDAFDTSGISKSPAIFDADKLTWMNAEYIRALPYDAFIEAAQPYFDRALPPGKFDLSIIARVLQPRLETLAQIPGKIAFIAAMPDYDISLFTHKKMKTDPAVALECITRAKEVLSDLTDWNEQPLHDALITLAERMEIKSGKLLFSLRIALSGVEVTPGGAIEIAALLGKEESIRRIDVALEMLALRM